MTITELEESPDIEKKDLDNIINGLKNSETATNVDIEKIANILENPKLQNLFKIHEVLEKAGKRDEKDEYIKSCLEVLNHLGNIPEDLSCRELTSIMNTPHFRCLIEAYESIVLESYRIENIFSNENTSSKGPPMRVVGLTKNSNEPLGISLAKHTDGCIYIQRILRGTSVDRQGLFNVGDVIKEINGEPVGDDPEEIHRQLQSINGSVTVKCISAFKNSHDGKCQVYLRCHFDYSPNQDEVFPKTEVGLSFQKGDILEVVDQSDPDWWQATHYGEPTRCGIIPSLKFEQRRKAANLIPKHKQNTVLSKFKKKGQKKIMYQTCKNSIFDCFDVRLYEEVVRMPTVENKVIALVGAQALGTRALITRLHNSYPDRYVTIKPDTSRSPKEGELQKNGYNFLTREEMHQEILAGKYFEWGEDNGNYYGSKLSAVRDVINSGKIAIMDCDPSALKFLRTAEFMPYIVFVEAPLEASQRNVQDSSAKPVVYKKADHEQILSESKDIDETYHHFFDHRIVATNTDDTYAALRESIEKHSEESHQWVPISWVY